MKRSIALKELILGTSGNFSHARSASIQMTKYEVKPKNVVQMSFLSYARIGLLGCDRITLLKELN